jgi:UDP-N-acetylmuramyl tripeptide synthase
MAARTAICTLQQHYPTHDIRVVFGCGGKRDQDKRAKMGKIASKHAHTPTLNNGSENNVFVV